MSCAFFSGQFHRKKVGGLAGQFNALLVTLTHANTPLKSNPKWPHFQVMDLCQKNLHIESSKPPLRELLHNFISLVSTLSFSFRIAWEDNLYSRKVDGQVTNQNSEFTENPSQLGFCGTWYYSWTGLWIIQSPVMGG